MRVRGVRGVIIGGLVLVLANRVVGQVRQPEGDVPSAATQQQLEAAVERLATVMLDMEGDDRPGYMMRAQRAAVARGKALFGNSALGRNGQTCESCHPNGRTIGGEAELPVQADFR